MATPLQCTYLSKPYELPKLKSKKALGTASQKAGDITMAILSRPPNEPIVRTPSSRTPRQEALPPSSELRVEMPSPSSAHRVEAPPPSCAHRVETPPPSSAHRVETPPPSSAHRVETPPPSSAHRVETPPPSSAHRVETPPPSSALTRGDSASKNIPCPESEWVKLDVTKKSLSSSEDDSDSENSWLLISPKQTPIKKESALLLRLFPRV